MDARCAQVYNALFRVEGGVVTRLTPDRALSIEQLDGELAECGPIILVGDGAELCYNTFKKVRSAVLAPESARFQRASSVARDVYKRQVLSHSLFPKYFSIKLS